MNELERLISERPNFHATETEIDRSFEPSESLLRRAATPGLTCYGIGSDVLGFIAETVGAGSRTLETGAGCSTLVFAFRRATHVAITPSAAEIGRIRLYARERGIGLDTVDFVAESSDRYLPRCDALKLDLVLLDGKHAFPWPMLDWFYTADRLRRGGVMLIDDVQIRSAGVVSEFMRSDPHWELTRDFSGRTLAFRKTGELVHDVAWHMQPWTVALSGAARPTLVRRVARRVRRMISRRET
jgi:hypothetical protein